jgi:hypothetical protein
MNDPIKDGHYIRMNYVCQLLRDFVRTYFETSRQCGNLCQPASAVYYTKSGLFLMSQAIVVTGLG